MSLLLTGLLVLQVFLAVLLVGLVLIQQGKGATAGAGLEVVLPVQCLVHEARVRS